MFAYFRIVAVLHKFETFWSKWYSVFLFQQKHWQISNANTTPVCFVWKRVNLCDTGISSCISWRTTMHRAFSILKKILKTCWLESLFNVDFCFYYRMSSWNALHHARHNFGEFPNTRQLNWWVFTYDIEWKLFLRTVDIWQRIRELLYDGYECAIKINHTRLVRFFEAVLVSISRLTLTCPDTTRWKSRITIELDTWFIIAIHFSFWRIWEKCFSRISNGLYHGKWESAWK